MTTVERNIRERLSEFYAPFEIDQWMGSPQKLLGGKTPRELIDDDQGDEVDRLLSQLDDCVYI